MPNYNNEFVVDSFRLEQEARRLRAQWFSSFFTRRPR